MAPANPLDADVLALLKKKTGLDDAEAWRNIWLLISKSEQNNEDPSKAFLTDKGKSLFGYASALSYDQHKRGVTMGIVGWTTGNNGHDGKGDAPELFRVYKSLGGEDLMPYCDGCCKSKGKCDTLINKIKDIQDDPKWIRAQWEQLAVKGGYLFETMAAFKKIGIVTPSALAIATVFDTSLNQGFGMFNLSHSVSYVFGYLKRFSCRWTRRRVRPSRQVGRQRRRRRDAESL